MKTFLAILAAGLSVGVANAEAQQQSSQDEVLAVVNRMFDGMRAKDTTVIRSTLLDDVKLMTAGNDRDGKAAVHVESMDNFLQSVGTAEGKLDERIFDPKVNVEDNLAAVWVRYEFWYNDQYSHCGIDAFQLARTEAGWKIATIADTRKKTCK